MSSIKVLIDTNFFIDIFRFKIDLDLISEIILSDYEIFTLSSVLDELKKISKKISKERKFARLALEFIKNRKIKILEMDGKVDECILKLVENDRKIIVATNDRRLRKALRNMKTKTIYIKSRKYLGIG